MFKLTIDIWYRTWDFQQCGKCDQQSLRSACAYMQSNQSLWWSLEYPMPIKPLTEHHLEFLSFKGGCTGLSKSTLVKTPHCLKSHVVAYISFYLRKQSSLRAYVSLSPSEAEFKTGIREIVAGFENTIGMYILLPSACCKTGTLYFIVNQDCLMSVYVGNTLRRGATTHNVLRSFLEKQDGVAIKGWIWEDPNFSSFRWFKKGCCQLHVKLLVNRLVKLA